MPFSVRVMLGHAAVQRVADLHAVDILHLKGFALDDTVSWEGRVGSDVDVLVRPDQVGRLLGALSASGWNWSIGFEAGSPFGHAATLLHEVWGYVDVHRHYPGITLSPAAAFDELWRERGESQIAGARCPVPSLAGQAVILVLHAARSEDKSRGQRDVDSAWGRATPQQRQDVTELVARLGAEVALAAAIGNLDAYQDRSDHDLWKVVSRGGTRIEEWWARIKAAPTMGAAIRLVLRAPLVNVEHLTIVMGRTPTRREVVKEFFARPVRGLREEWRVRHARSAGSR